MMMLQLMKPVILVWVDLKPIWDPEEGEDHHDCQGAAVSVVLDKDKDTDDQSNMC